MAIVNIEKKLLCLRCGHRWDNKKPEVRICPGCKSAYWDTQSKKSLNKANLATKKK